MNRRPVVARSRASAASLAVGDAGPAAAIETTARTVMSPTLTEGMQTMINNTKDFIAFGTENLEALATAGKIWATGVQDLTQQVTATAKTSLEESVATFKALSAAKSVKEAVDLQSTYSKTLAVKALAESTRLTEASMKLTEQALAPLTARVAAAVEVFSTAA